MDKAFAATTPSPHAHPQIKYSPARNDAEQWITECANLKAEIEFANHK